MLGPIHIGVRDFSFQPDVLFASGAANRAAATASAQGVGVAHAMPANKSRSLSPAGAKLAVVQR